MSSAFVASALLLVACATPSSRLLASGEGPVYQNELRPFTTDGCSDFPNGVPYFQAKAWLGCCIRHDLLYWQGGTSQQKLEADEFLRSCVSDAGHPEIGEMMYLGVRKGGDAKLPTSFAWGYGWAMNRGYAPLDADELTQVDKLKAELPANLDQMPITKAPNIRPADHLTNDRCFDEAVVHIEQALKRSFRIETQSKMDWNKGPLFGRDLQITPDGCPEPFRFRFLLSKEGACTDLAPSELVERARVSLGKATDPEGCR